MAAADFSGLLAPTSTVSDPTRAGASTLAALVSLGYSRAPAEKAVQGAIRRLGAAPVLEAVIRLALGDLSGSRTG